MNDEELSRIIGKLIEATGQYLQWYKRYSDDAGQAIAKLDPQAGHSASESTRRAMTSYEKMMDAKDAVVSCVNQVVGDLEGRGHDTTNLLKLVHFIDGGGGPTNAFTLWATLKVWLQRIILKIAPAEAEDVAPVERQPQLPPPLTNNQAVILGEHVKKLGKRLRIADFVKLSMATKTKKDVVNELIRMKMLNRDAGERMGTAIEPAGIEAFRWWEKSLRES